MATTLDIIIKETKAAFIIAKGDGVLDVSEVINIAVELSQKIQKMSSLSGSEKKSVLLLTLKKGLDASGGIGMLPGFANTSAKDKAVFEESLLNSASVAIDAIIMAANGKLDLRKPSSWQACLPSCLSTVQQMIPKDQVLLKEALEFSGKIVNKHVETPVKDVSEVITALPGTPSKK